MSTVQPTQVESGKWKVENKDGRELSVFRFSLSRFSFSTFRFQFDIQFGIEIGLIGDLLAITRCFPALVRIAGFALAASRQKTWHFWSVLRRFWSVFDRFWDVFGIFGTHLRHSIAADGKPHTHPGGSDPCNFLKQNDD